MGASLRAVELGLLGPLQPIDGLGSQPDDDCLKCAMSGRKPAA